MLDVCQVLSSPDVIWWTVDYCDVFISSHSDGTHSLMQWCISPNLMKKQTHPNPGWTEDEDIYGTSELFGWNISLKPVVCAPIHKTTRNIVWMYHILYSKLMSHCFKRTGGTRRLSLTTIAHGTSSCTTGFITTSTETFSGWGPSLLKLLKLVSCLNNPDLKSSQSSADGSHAPIGRHALRVCCFCISSWIRLHLGLRILLPGHVLHVRGHRW